MTLTTLIAQVKDADASVQVETRVSLQIIAAYKRDQFYASVTPALVEMLEEARVALSDIAGAYRGEVAGETANATLARINAMAEGMMP